MAAEWDVDVKEETDKLLKEYNEEEASKEKEEGVTAEKDKMDPEFRNELRSFVALKNVFCSPKWFKLVGDQLANLRVIK